MTNNYNHSFQSNLFNSSSGLNTDNNNNKIDNKIESFFPSATSSTSDDTGSTICLFSSSQVSSPNLSINQYSFVNFPTLDSDNIFSIPLIERVSEFNYDSACATLPSFFDSPLNIKIPVKVERALRRYVPRILLKEIDSDIDTAVELCLLFLSNLSDTYFRMREAKNSRAKEGWKILNSKLLHVQTSFTNQNRVYKKIIDCLTVGTKQGGIIERDENAKYQFCRNGSRSYYYRLTESYRAKGVVTYTLTTKKAIKLNSRAYFKNIEKAFQNPITKNLIRLYYQIDLPTIEEIIEEAKRLIAEGFENKGKRLVFKNKNSESRFKTPVTFVEDCIELFEYLTKRGKFMIPSVGDYKSGGRVVDSFTLMPRWIRRLIKINGRPIVELDYSCLHPNIAMALYGGKSEFITHQKVAEESNIYLKRIKEEHLSFFNKIWSDMYHSPLFEYYFKKEPELMSNIYADKEKDYKITCQKLFKKEVEIMTDVIERLNEEGITVGYVYDALFCSPEHAEMVKNVMNEVVLLHGVKTICK